MSGQHSRGRSLLTLALKIALVGAFLYLLFQRGFISLEKMREAFGQPSFVVPAMLVIVASNIAGGLRWQILLRAQDIRLPFRRIMQLHFIGLFFNYLIPGAISGDFVKAFYVGKESPGRRADAFGSILFDRIVGLSALVVISASALILGLDEFRGTSLLGAIRVFMTIGAVAVVSFFTYLFLVREKHDPLLILLRKLSARFPRLGSVARIYEGLRRYHNHRLAVAGVLLMSMVIHLSLGWVCLSFAHALGDQHLPLLSLYLVVPIGMLVTAVPIAPAGVGTGHVAFAYFFHLIGSERGADVFSLYALGGLFTGLLGGLVYLQFKSRHPEMDMALNGVTE